MRCGTSSGSRIGCVRVHDPSCYGGSTQERERVFKALEGVMQNLGGPSSKKRKVIDDLFCSMLHLYGGRLWRKLSADSL